MLHPTSSSAQSDYLHQEEVNKDILIQKLALPDSPATIRGLPTNMPVGRTRGLSRGIRTKQKVKCASVRTRGIRLKKADTPSVPIEIRFAVNSAQLAAGATQALDELAAALASPTLSTCCIEIQGHTDDTGNDTHNRTLSEHRARSVQRYLTRNNVDADRLSIVGLGEDAPMVPNTDDYARQQNRRVEIVNLGTGKSITK